MLFGDLLAGCCLIQSFEIGAPCKILNTEQQVRQQHFVVSAGVTSHVSNVHALTVVVLYPGQPDSLWSKAEFFFVAVLSAGLIFSKN